MATSPIVGTNDLATARRVAVMGMKFVGLTSEPLGKLAIRTAEERIRVHNNLEELQVWMNSLDSNLQVSVP